jgi:hypothetical protein
MGVTTDDMYDSEILLSLVMDASRCRTIIEACMDGACDSSKTYALLKKVCINPIIKPREETLERIMGLLRDIDQS